MTLPDRTDGCFEPAPGIAWREIGGRVVVLQPLTDQLMTLNATGGAIWKRLDGATDAAAIARDLAAAYRVTPDEAISDIRTFVDDMVSRGLLVRRDGEPE